MSDPGPRVLRWPDVVPASRMMARVYMKRPLPRAGRRTRAVLTWMAAVMFALNLALYRPFVRYWTDPAAVRDRPKAVCRQTVVAIVPHDRARVPLLRGMFGVIVFYAVYLGLLVLIPDPALAQIDFGIVGVLAIAAFLVVVVPVVASLVVFWMPYEGKIMCCGPKVPGTQLTASFAASTSGSGMRDVHAYLNAHHSGKRLTICARDKQVRTFYRTLGLKEVAPQCGRMTGVIPGR